jgi:putative endonuclease
MIQTLFKCHPRPQAEDPGGKSTNFNIQYMLEGRTYYVYILANQRNGTVYVGFTHSLLNRIDEHKNNKYCGFTQKYNVKRLVYFEIFNDPNTAILREKTIKHLYRKKKIELIEKNNPTWRDLYYNILRAYS